MRKSFTLFAFFLICQVISAQQKPDSLSPIQWTDTIKSAQFNEGVISDPLQLILGKEPGAEVYKAGSDPNVPSVLMIRGTNGLYGETNPLYVIDGIIGGDLFMVPPQEIASVKILKNFSETSFYGSEGSNGVILVTTKKGNKNKRLSVNFNTAVSLGQTNGLSNLLSANDMREQSQTHQDIQFNDGGASTDWQDEIFRTTVSQSYQLALGGTLKNTGYRLSFDYIGQPGNVRGSDRNMTGGSVSLSQTAFKKKLQFDALISFYRSKSNFISYPSGRNGQNLFYQTFNHNPTDPVYTSDGSSYYQAQRVFQYYNPVAMINMITNEARSDQLSAVLNARWDFWKGLGIKFSGSYGGNKTNTLYNRLAEAFPGANAFTRDGSDNYSRINLLTGLTFNKCLVKKHFLDLFAGYVFRATSQENEYYAYHDNSSTGDHYLSSLQYRDHSLRADLNYNFMQKYHLSFVINQEYDQSNVTPEEDGATLDWGQWNFYPGISASWEINREKFMKNVKPISTLILKGSYGIAGARPKSLFFTGSNERTVEFAAGLDAGFLRNRIMAKIEYYHRNTDNAIIRGFLPVPPNITPYLYWNGMKLINSGIEFMVMARVIDEKKIIWNSTLCFSWNKNKVISIDDDGSMNSGYVDYYISYSDSPFVITTTTGHSLLAFNLPVSIGYYQGQPVYETENGGATNNVDLAKRGISDRVFPEYNISWTNSFTIFKFIDLSLMFRYVAGYSIFNGTRMYLSVPSNYLTLNTLPEAETNYDEGVFQIPFSDMYLENASYLRFENLSVGYTFVPQNMKWKGRLRVYLAVNNLFTITGYGGLDPSFNYNSPGLDYFNTYPKNHEYTLGINLEI